MKLWLHSSRSVPCFPACCLQAIKAAVILLMMKKKDDAFVQKLAHRPSKRNFCQFAFDSKVMYKKSLLFLSSYISCVSLEESFLFIHLFTLFRQPD